MVKPASSVVLIIDDEQTVRSTAQAILTHVGYEVHAADGGRSGIAELARLGARIDVVLLDWTLPDLGGSAALVMREVAKHAPQAHVIVSSGFGRDDLTGASNHPDVHFLEKPYSAATLVAAVQQAARRRREGPMQAES